MPGVWVRGASPFPRGLCFRGGVENPSERDTAECIEEVYLPKGIWL